MHDNGIKIGLVLGGGGARGFAHVGVLRSLENHGVQVCAVAACSIGGIIGALHASGQSATRIQTMFESIDLIRLLDRSKMGGLLGGARVSGLLQRYLPRTFEELAIPLAVTAVDVQRGKLVVLNKGELVPALLGSSALPGIFAAVRHSGRVLVDGGLLNNLPVDVIRTMTLAPVVAVDTTEPADRHLVFSDERPVWEKVRRPVLRGKRPLMFEMMMKAIDIPRAPLNSMRLSLHPPEVLIRPPLDPDLKVEDYLRFREAMECGYAATERHLQEDLPILADNQ